MSAKTSTLTSTSAAAVLLVLATHGSDQMSQKEAAFEAASVKAVNPAGLGGRALPSFLAQAMGFRGGPGSSDPGRIDYSGVTMRMLLRRAYSLRSEQIVGPGWIDEQYYEVIAKVSPDSDDQRVRLMLRSLLTERFQMQLHREMKMMAVYALVIAKGGPKLQPGETPQSRDPKDLAEQQRKALAAHQPGQFHFNLSNASVADLIEVLSMGVDRPVLDRTQFQGKFASDFSYYQIPPGQDVAAGPSIFEAVKAQLGLELIPAKSEVEVLVIDRAARLPASN
jgi:uncharacterized protein (TIGR03435 family)